MARPHQVSHDAQPDGRRGSALSGADAHESECATPSTVPADARAEWWAAPEEDVADVGVTGGLLERPLLPLWVFMSVMGVGAPAYHAESRSYRMRWTSPSGAATLAASAAVVALTGVSVVSLARHLLSTEEDPDQRPVQSLKTIGVLIVGGYQVNALVQVLNTAAGAARHARLLSAWTRLAALHHINPTRGLRRKCYIQVAFMTAFIAAMLTAAALGRPRFVGHVLEGNAERLYLIPRSLLRDSASLPAKVRPLPPLSFLPFPLRRHWHTLTAPLPSTPPGGAGGRVLCRPPPLRHQQELPVRLHHPLPPAAGRPHRLEHTPRPGH
ncbi:hypothetical protein E2C01_009763 [Portunus trituberculatus]|uniref:Uncharacterized protein n=1 Tax=Portunus trituberculatus TaxID=210409 RepID=A0A5B7D6L8_PORTR|nr:hypothetical protein [Portunus trituberculatus]